MENQTPPPAWKTIAAFAILYFVWGSTFLAIRVGVHEVPPFLFAAMRFLTAGLILFWWMKAKSEPTPTRTQWSSALMLGLLIFVINYGLLFWSEQHIPSGIAAVMLATIPLFMSLAEILFLHTQRLTLRLVLSLLIGLAGVAVLMSHSFHLGGEPIQTRYAVALIVSAISWSIGSALTRKLPLPSSKVMSSASQMLAGGAMLALTSVAFGEFGRFHPAAVSQRAWFALLYLIGAGSILAFTTYVWLIHHQTPTRVGTYAYVNPVVAVLLGYLLGGEALGLRTVLGALCVLTSVVVITLTPAVKPAA